MTVPYSIQKYFLVLGTIIILLTDSQYIVAQDAQFTQLYASPLYNNPAFTGSQHRSRISANYRYQWSGVPAPLTNYNAAFDTYINKANSGVGAMLHRQNNGGSWNTTSFNLFYAYHLKISRNWAVAAGVQAAYAWRSANVQNLTFGYQPGGNGTYDPINDPLQAVATQKNYIDLGFGGLAYSERAWIGLAASHLTQPNIGLDNVSRLPIRYTLNAGYQFPLEDIKLLKRNQEPTKGITPMLQYRHQGTANQLDAGIYLHYQMLLAGAMYRGLPLKSSYGKPNQDAFALMIGTQINGITLGYSYDISLSGVTPFSGGSHEIGLVYIFGDGHRFSGPGLPCPKL